MLSDHSKSGNALILHAREKLQFLHSSISPGSAETLVRRGGITNHHLIHTVKPEIFACLLFREFRDLRQFVKITDREYSNVNHLLSTSLIEPNTKLTRNGH